MKNKKIAWLVYKPEKKRNKENTFDSNYNIGALVINNELIKADFKVGYVTPESANDADYILVSFTSTYDLIAYYKAVSKYKYFKERKFKVICGGFGLQNIYSIRNYIDIAVFGRAEDIIIDIINGNYNYDNVMVLPDIKAVKVRQADSLYNDKIETKGHTSSWQEQFIGCTNKCMFCHYTWARKWISNKDTYYQGHLTANKSVEILWKDICRIDSKQGRIRTAIDGFSERLREIFGKKITNQEIVKGIEKLGSFEGNTVVLTYNISNMPSEVGEDYQELIDTIKQAQPKYRVIVVLQSTPFRPSSLTPMQWMPVKLFPNWNDLAAKEIIERPNLRFTHSFSNESAWSQLETVIIERATEQSDKLINTICFSPKLKKWDAKTKVKILQDNFDLSQYIREYDVNEQLPTWYLESYISNDKIKKMAVMLKQKLGLNNN